MSDSDNDHNRDESTKPRVSNRPRTTGYANTLLIYNKLVKDLNLKGEESGESNPAMNTWGSVGPPKTGDGPETLLKPKNIVRSARSSRFTPLAFYRDSSQEATPTSASWSPLILTADLVWKGPGVKDDVRNKFFSRPQMFVLHSDDERLVVVQFQIWAPYSFKPLIRALASYIIKYKLFDSKKLVLWSRIVADVLSPMIVAFEVRALGRDEESNVKIFGKYLEETLKEAKSPDVPMMIYPDNPLSGEEQKELGAKLSVFAKAAASREMCDFFNMVGGCLRRIVDPRGRTTYPWRAFDRFGEWRTFMLKSYDIIALESPEYERETLRKFNVVLETLRDTVDSMNASLISKQNVDVVDLHCLKVATLDFICTDIAAQASLLRAPSDEVRMYVSLARDVSYEMYRMAFPHPQKIYVRKLKSEQKSVDTA